MPLFAANRIYSYSAKKMLMKENVAKEVQQFVMQDVRGLHRFERAEVEVSSPSSANFCPRTFINLHTA